MKHLPVYNMISTPGLLLIAFLVIVGFSSCEDQFEGNEKYQRPEWLVGKLYTQIEARPDLSLFAECMRDVGYDSIVNKSGAYAAFIPTNTALQEYLSINSYASIADIPFDKKMKMVKIHLVQMPWNVNQLQSLSENGWINENDESNNKPFAFKRQTLLRNENKTYPVRIQKLGVTVVETIVPEQDSNGTKTVFSNSRKYVPLFFDKYLSAANMTGNDFSYYFNRPYEAGNIYYAGAKIISEEIFSDNGFIYAIDKVVEPLLNAEELMEKGFENQSYSSFKDLINQGSVFTFNRDATFAQPGANKGQEVDELFDLTYTGIQFDIHQELTSLEKESQTMQDHYGIVVPTDEAFEEFVNDIIKKSGKLNSIDDIPVNLKRMIINYHMSDKPIYENEIVNGYYNSLGDFVKLDESTIIHKEFGSNTTFIGVNKMLVPKALSSVSGFLYLDPGYLTYLMALNFSDLLGALKDENTHFSLFVIPNRVFVEDLSMEIIWANSWRRDAFALQGIIPDVGKFYYKRNEVADLMFSQIGIEPLIGLAKKEFIETLNGKHIVVDNIDKTITGGASSYFGAGGDSLITVGFSPLQGDYYNGNVYEINGWLRFPGQGFLTRIYGTEYFNLLVKAGLATEFVLRFAHETERYTLFLPSNAALDAAQADTLTGDHLKHFLLSHILKNELIFTDGRKSEGSFNTMSKKANRSHKLHIRPSIDNISILDGNGNIIVDIPENTGKTNIITVKTLNNIVSTSAVIHHIDTIIPLME